MKTVFAFIAVLIIAIAAATTLLYASAPEGYEEERVALTEVKISESIQK
ncbi:hypothetical protein [Flammeovirga sp. SJP92]|nr:hypothetical protein [Flammeovirga sp. SJP92]